MRLALTLALLLASAAGAQEVTFPADQFGRSTLYAAQSTDNFESVLTGRDSRFEPLMDYAQSDPLRQLSRSVGRLDILTSAGVSTCTAALVADDRILTNYHCVPRMDDAPIQDASLLMGYYSDIDHAGEQRYQVNTSPIEANRALDYAVLEVEGAPGAEWGVLNLVDADPAPGGSLMIIHHPAGRPKHVTRGGCRAASPNAFQGDQIYHKCDTLPGSSGSPVLRGDMTGGVVGLHHAGAPANTLGANAYNYAKRMSLILETSDVLGGAENPTTTPPPSPSPPPASMVEYAGDLKAELEGCERQGGQVTCRAMVVNEGASKQVTFVTGSYGSERTRIYLVDGYDVRGAQITAGGESHTRRVSRDMPSNIPVRVEVRFEAADDGASGLAMFLLSTSEGDLEFRNVPFDGASAPVALAPIPAGPVHVAGDFELIYDGCARRGASVRCTVVVTNTQGVKKSATIVTGSYGYERTRLYLPNGDDVRGASISIGGETHSRRITRDYPGGVPARVHVDFQGIDHAIAGFPVFRLSTSDGDVAFPDAMIDGAPGPAPRAPLPSGEPQVAGDLKVLLDGCTRRGSNVDCAAVVENTSAAFETVTIVSGSYASERSRAYLPSGEDVRGAQVTVGGESHSRRVTRAFPPGLPGWAVVRFEGVAADVTSLSLFRLSTGEGDVEFADVPIDEG